MATTLQIRRGTAAAAAAFTGAEGEFFLDTDNMIMYIHDGTTQGGKPMANKDQITLDFATDQGDTTTNDVTVNNFTVAGNLDVLGTTTTINTVEMDITDKNITIGSGAANAGQSDGGGLTLDLGSQGAATINYNNSDDAWTVNKSIVPEYDNVYDLGTASKTFRHVYVGPGSLYVNGQQVITDDSGTITVTADPDQNLQLKTVDSGDLQFVCGATGTITVNGTMQVGSGYNITDSAGTEVNFGDNIEMNANKITGIGAPTNNADAATKIYVDDQFGSISQSSIAQGNSNVSVVDTGSGTVAITIDGTTAFEVTSAGVEITGDLIVGGPTTTLQSNALSIFDNIITLNADATGAPSESVGIEVERGDEANTSIRWNEASDTWTFTNDGATYNPIATSTADLQEVTNLYYTDERARDAVSAGGDLSYNSTSGEFSYSNIDTLDTVTGRGATTTNDVTFGNITTTGYIAGPASMVIDPAAVGDNTGVVVIAGDLQVDGTTTTINSATLEVTDKNIVVANGAANAAAATGAGLTVDLGTNGSATLTYAEASDSFNFNKELYIAGSKALTVGDEGAGNGLDADLLDGQQGSYYAVVTTVNNALALKLDAANYTAGDILTKMLTVDGASSGLDADLLDGQQGSHYAVATTVNNALALKLDASAYTAADVLTKLIGVDGTGSGLDADKLDGQEGSYYAVAGVTYTETEVDNLLDDKLDASAYTAADVLTKIKTVDGSGSGLDADLLDGHSTSYFATSGHNHDTTYLGLHAKADDADKLDGHDSTYFAVAANTDTSGEVDAKIAALVDSSPAALDTLNELAAALGDDPNFATTINNSIALKLDSSAYTAADVLTKIKTVDGAGSGLDADLLDGHSTSYFATSGHNHDADYLGITAKAADADKLDGHDSTYFAVASTTYSETEVDNLLDDKLDASAYTAADVLAKLITVDGSGSGLNADLLDGESSSHYAVASHNHDATYLGKTANAVSASKLATARTIGLSGDVTGSVSFDGSANVSITAVVANDSHTHDTRYFTETEADARFLAIGGKAADANLLDGHDSTYFAVAGNTDTSSEVDAKISAVVNAAPATLDTLNELAAALNDDPNFATTVTNQIAGKLDATATAVKATKLATARTIDITGDITATAVAFDGSSNISISASVNNDSHSHSNYIINNGNDTHAGNITPSTSDNYTLGDASHKYSAVYATTFYGTSTTAQYADLAEKYTVEGTPGVGEVVVIGSDSADCSVSDEIASQAVLGVVSTNPAFKMNSESDGEYIALKGRVPCKVIGPVAKGEPLVSGPNGCAMGINSVDAGLSAMPGIIFGKALDALNEGTSVIEVIVL